MNRLKHGSIVVAALIVVASLTGRSSATESRTPPPVAVAPTGGAGVPAAAEARSRDALPTALPRTAAAVEADIFAPRSWEPEPAPQRVRATRAARREPVQPDSRTPPPLPFSYLGRFHDDSGRLTVYLLRDGNALAVGEGQVIDNLYRVEKIGQDQVILTYLPLSAQQTIWTGGAS